MCIVFFDISKAFDTVPHVPLLETSESKYKRISSQVDQKLSPAEIPICCRRRTRL